MPVFSTRSQNHLATAHHDLQVLFNEVIKTRDCSVICGARPRADQVAAYASGASLVQWPDSSHNIDGRRRSTAWAVDVVPYPLDWDDIGAFQALRKTVESIAANLLAERRMRYALRPLIYLGRGKTKPDHPHYELVGVNHGE